MTELRQREPREVCPTFLAFLRGWPCVNCGASPPTQASHIRMACPERGKRECGKGEKPDDRWAIPLCADCHLNGPDALHKIGEKRFFAGWDPFAEAARFYSAFLDEGGAIPKRRHTRRPHRADNRARSKRSWPTRAFPRGRKLAKRAT